MLCWRLSPRLMFKQVPLSSDVLYAGEDSIACFTALFTARCTLGLIVETSRTAQKVIRPEVPVAAINMKSGSSAAHLRLMKRAQDQLRPPLAAE